MLNFLHTYLPNPILLAIGNVSIHWYGLILGAAILLGYGLAIRLARGRSLDIELISSIYINLIIWGFVGARIYHVLNDSSYYWQNPGKIIAVWEGGLAIHGAIIAGLITLYYYTRRHKIGFWALADLFSLPLILGQALGRWGNYFNQELFGKPTNLPWGIPIELQNRPADFVNYNYFHPTFLYESVWDGLVFIILLFVLKKKTRDGLVFWVYLGWYAIGRAGVELLRINDAATVFGTRLPLLVSMVFAVVATVMIFRLLAKPGAQFRKF